MLRSSRWLGFEFHRLVRMMIKKLSIFVPMSEMRYSLAFRKELYCLLEARRMRRNNLPNIPSFRLIPCLLIRSSSVDDYYEPNKSLRVLIDDTLVGFEACYLRPKQVDVMCFQVSSSCIVASWYSHKRRQNFVQLTSERPIDRIQWQRRIHMNLSFIESSRTWRLFASSSILGFSRLSEQSFQRFS